MSDQIEQIARPGDVLRCKALHKEFTQGGQTIEVLRAIDFTLGAGEQAAIIGTSGSGKSTLLHLLGGLDRPTSGEIYVAGEPMHRLGATAQGRVRNRALGFIYQFHHLLPEFSALENVAMPLLARRMQVAEAHKRAAAMLDEVGLAKRMDHKPAQLSGGERQRVAVARALVTEPACVLADEPTGSLDPGNAERVLAMMRTLNRTHGTALLVATHDREVARAMGTVYQLRMGSMHRI